MHWPALTLFALTACGGDCSFPLSRACDEGLCVAFEEALTGRYGRHDAGGLGPAQEYSCDDGGQEVSAGILYGTTWHYDASGELLAVVTWSDDSDFCGGTSHSALYGEIPERYCSRVSPPDTADTAEGG